MCLGYVSALFFQYLCFEFIIVTPFQDCVTIDKCNSLLYDLVCEIMVICYCCSYYYCFFTGSMPLIPLIILF